MQDVRAVVADVLDPEVPVLTIEDLGILRDVRVDEDGHVEVVITPTYSGCPASSVEASIVETLHAAGHDDVAVTTVLAPAWTTDWMSEEGSPKAARVRHRAPGTRYHSHGGPVLVSLGSAARSAVRVTTREVSHFGSTACKSLWVCNSCQEPFDHFKAL